MLKAYPFFRIYWGFGSSFALFAFNGNFAFLHFIFLFEKAFL